MTYAISSALQQHVYETLAGDTNVTSLVGANVFDQAPSGAVPSLYVVLGTEQVRDRSDKSGHGAQHDFVVSIVSGEAGFKLAKDAAAFVCDALLDLAGPLTRGRLISLNFLNARARRVDHATGRQIDLRFRARVSDD